MSGKHWLNDRTVFSIPVTPVVRHCENKDFECHWAKGAFILIIILCIFIHKVGPGLHSLLNALFRLNKIRRISWKNPIWHQESWPTFTDHWQLKFCCSEVILMPKGQSWLKHNKTYIIIAEALNCKKHRNTDKYLYKYGTSKIFINQTLNFKRLLCLPIIYYLVFFYRRKRYSVPPIKVHKLSSGLCLSCKSSGKLTAFETGFKFIVQMPRIFNTYLLSEIPNSMPLCFGKLCHRIYL